MDFSIKAFDTKTTLAAAKAGVVAVAVFENKTLSQAAKALDAGGDITAALKSGDISGKAGSTLLLRGVKGVGEVKCPDEIRAGCAAPDGHGMVLVCELVNGVA